ncbi:MAG: energy-coupled thiamine transporter ThiT [Clostridia bacterium]|nr:energy-coupled thiamine transporter ThiT [Clostridia bacterium]
MQHTKTRRLVTSAMLLSLATAISLVAEWIPFLNLPFGGTITPASLLPLVLVSYLYGLPWGFGSAFVYSVLQMAVGFRTVSGLFLPSSDSYMGSLGAALAILLLDYVFAFTAVGIGGLWRKKLDTKWALVWGSVLGLSLCYLFHVLSGAIFYGAWAEWFFTESAAKSFGFSAFVMEHFSGFGLATVYSVVYNGCYMIPEILITAVAGAAVSRIPLLKRIK